MTGFDEHTKIPVEGIDLDGPVDYEKLRKAILEKGPIRELNKDTGREIFLDITPCQCGFENCNEDVISVLIIHGVTSLRTMVEKEDLLEAESLTVFLDSVFHHPENFYSSSGDEQMIELELFRKLGLFPFEIYHSDDWVATLLEQTQTEDFQERVAQVGYWEAHSLMTLLRTLTIKRKLQQFADSDEKFARTDLPQFMSNTFDIGFLAGRLYSEYRGKIYLEEKVMEGEKSRDNIKSRTDASGKRSAKKRESNLEIFMTEVERLGSHFPVFSERQILDQAYEKSSNLTEMPKSKKTRDDYEIALRSENKFKSRYFKIFGKTL